jgi:hypothetical protein
MKLGYKGKEIRRGGMPSWMKAPADGSMNTMATQSHTNPLTGETWMASSGGYSVRPTWDGNSFSQHSGKSYSVDPNNPNNYIGKFRDDYALQPGDPGYIEGGPALLPPEPGLSNQGPSEWSKKGPGYIEGGPALLPPEPGLEQIGQPYAGGGNLDQGRYVGNPNHRGPMIPEQGQSKPFVDEKGRPGAPVDPIMAGYDDWAMDTYGRNNFMDTADSQSSWYRGKQSFGSGSAASRKNKYLDSIGRSDLYSPDYTSNGMPQPGSPVSPDISTTQGGKGGGHINGIKKEAPQEFMQAQNHMPQGAPTPTQEQLNINNGYQYNNPADTYAGVQQSQPTATTGSAYTPTAQPYLGIASLQVGGTPPTEVPSYFNLPSSGGITAVPNNTQQPNHNSFMRGEQSFNRFMDPVGMNTQQGNPYGVKTQGQPGGDYVPSNGSNAWWK